MRVLGFLAALALAAAPALAETIAFTGATVIDGTGRAAIANGVVVVTDGKIATVGPRGTAIPAGARRIDVRGKTIMPGLVNAHAHVNADPKSSVPAATQLTGQLALYARYGVTTVQSLGDDGIESVRLRDALRDATPADRPLVARLLVSGPVLNAKDPAGGRATVMENARRGVDVIKIRLEGPPDAPIRQPEVYGAMIAQAHAEKLRVAAHMFTADETAGLVKAKVDLLAHSIRDRDVDPALVGAIKGQGIPYIPTLTRELSVYAYEETPSFVSDPFFAREAAYKAPLAALLAPEAQAKVRGSASAQAIKQAMVQAKRNLKALSDAGVPIAMGTDTGAGAGRWQGYFEHVELALMVEAGLTPMQALVAATGGAAKALRIDAQVGTLQRGRDADLLVLAASPIADIRNTRTLEQVWIGGRRLN